MLKKSCNLLPNLSKSMQYNIIFYTYLASVSSFELNFYPRASSSLVRNNQQASNQAVKKAESNIVSSFPSSRIRLVRKYSGTSIYAVYYTSTDSSLHRCNLLHYVDNILYTRQDVVNSLYFTISRFHCTEIPKTSPPTEEEEALPLLST